MDILLSTPRLTLRRFTPEDVDLLADLDSDPDVMFRITGGAATPRQEIVDDYLPAFLRYYREGDRWGFWVAEETASGEFVGWFHLRPGEGHPDDDPELGYRLRKAFWGKGLATEGSAALVDRAFADCGARRVWAETMVAHAASRRVMEKVGMRLVRTFHADWPVRIPGDELGDVEYAITREEWEFRRRGGRR
jgi:RimJ/RimL family protein N-acetyltransferase